MSTSPESFLTVLLVEDEQAIRRFVRAALEGVGCRVHEADNLHRGLLEAGTRQPDLIILDLGLPDGDGVDFIRDLRAWSGVPVLVLSARIEEYDKVEALDAGADDVQTDEEGVIEVICPPQAFAAVRDAFAQRNLVPEMADIVMKPNNEVNLTGEDAIKMQKLLDAIENLDDVQEVYTNAVMEEQG